MYLFVISQAGGVWIDTCINLRNVVRFCVGHSERHKENANFNWRFKKLFFI